MSEQTNALHLARSRILELEAVLQEAKSLLAFVGCPTDWVDAALARSVLNKENGNG